MIARQLPARELEQIAWRLSPLRTLKASAISRNYRKTCACHRDDLDSTMVPFHPDCSRARLITTARNRAGDARSSDIGFRAPRRLEQSRGLVDQRWGPRGDDQRVLALLADADSIVVPAIVVGGLEAAFASGSRSRTHVQVLEEFLAEPTVYVEPVDREIARNYGRIMSRLRRAGTLVPVNDIWTAAIAVRVAGHLLTFDGDFTRITEVQSNILTPSGR